MAIAGNVVRFYITISTIRREGCLGGREGAGVDGDIGYRVDCFDHALLMLLDSG